MKLFDTHTHLYDEAFDEDREALIAAMPAEGVRKILLCASDLESSRTVAAMAAERSSEELSMIAAVGIHPHEATQLDDAALAEIAEGLAKPRVVALGEIGLDYYYDHSPRPVQREAMARQILLANACGKPVIFHIRDAWGDFFDVMRDARPDRANMHCWTGSLESVKRCLDMGMMISFSGSVTFKNAHNLREVAAYVPADRLLIETDCPYLTPVPFRGKRNDPIHVGLVARCLADVRQVSVEEIAECTWDNGTRFFGL